MVKNLISVLIAVLMLFCFMGCEPEATPVQKGTLDAVSVEQGAVKELPTTESTSTIKSEEDLTKVIEVIAEDDLFLALSDTPESEIDYSEDLQALGSVVKFTSRAAAAKTIEDITNDVNKFVEEISDLYTTFNTDLTTKGKASAKIEDSFNYSDVATGIDGVNLKKLEANVLINASGAVDQKTYVTSMGLNGDAFANANASVEPQKILNALAPEASLSTAIKGCFANAALSIASDNFQVKATPQIDVEESVAINFSGLLKGATKANLGFTVDTPEVAGRVIVDAQVAVALNATEAQDLFESEDTEKFEQDLEAFIKKSINFDLTFTCYDNDGKQTFTKSYKTLEELEKLFESFMVEVEPIE